ncbi:MAG: ABC transporter permease [Acidobacteriales bacterium]|nr:ABC transporter permease [Candidatus Koribacter versatilis]MBI3644975.1 ABC transporter permease [Terriglobales bacterium]
MNFIEAIKIAFQSLWANKLRSALTLLGVVIGIAAVIAVVTFVAGINGYVATKVFNLGADVFIVFKVSPVTSNIDHLLEGEKRKNLTMDDYQAVREACKHCEWVGASLRNDVGHVRYGEQAINDTTVRGVTPSMVPILDIDLVAGRMLNETDVSSNSAVAVVGPDVVDTLMPGADPIDKEIRVDGWVYRIIGVGKRKGKTLGQSMDNYALIPITAFQKQHGSHDNIRISGKSAITGAGMEEAMDETRAILRARRHDRPGADDSFDIETNASLLSIWASFSQTFFFAMIGIAAISLVVGGIVIMNIMLVSVTERTREIGIRKALGAKRDDILGQFLIEAVALALLGGVIGVVLGISLAKGVTFLIGMPSSVPAWAVAAGVLMAASVGIFFGVYPARKAALLDPIAALRFET